jgi:hypothetical protein
VARWILRFGTESPQLDRLAGHLLAGRTNLWSLAGSVLTQAERYEDYLVLARRLPLRGPEGAKVHTVAALRQDEPAALAVVIEQVEADVELWPAVLPELGSAPREAVGVPDIMLRALRQAPPRLAGPVARAFATYLSRAPDGAAAHLSAVLASLLGVRAQIPDTALDQHIAKLVSTQRAGQVAPGAPKVLTSFYPRLGTLGRQAVVHVYLDRRGAWTEHEITSLARVALASPCPKLTDFDSVDLLRLFWDSAQVRAERGWHSWRELMGDGLPPGHWHNAKVKFLAILANSDAALRANIVEELLDGRVVSQETHINLFERIAADQPDWLAKVLLARNTPADPRAVGAVCSACGVLAARLPSATSLALIHWLAPRRTTRPRQVWPAQIVLAGRSVTLQRRLFEDLIIANEPQPVIDSAVDAWLFRTTPEVLNELAPDLRRLLQGDDPDVLQTRARLEARRAQVEPQARAWVANRVLQGASSAVAGTSVKTLADQVANLPLDKAFAQWLASLTVTPHTDAARRLLALVCAAEVVDDEAYRSILPSLVPNLLDRLDRAISRHEDPQLAQAILDCLIRADRTSPLDPDIARRVYSAMVERFPKDPAKAADPDAPATVSNVVKLCGTLMATCLPPDEVREHIGVLLSGFDPGAIANKTTRSVASMLVGMQGRDPQASDWMEVLFGRETTMLGVRLAIAEAFLVGDRWRQDGRASRLKDRPDCPPEVATYIINNLQT